jgi:nucleoid-associated protein
MIKNHFFSIFLIRDKTGTKFKLNANNITIDEVIHADTDKLAMACRINITNYENRNVTTSNNYLGFISIRQPETSEYFLQWIGAEKRKQDTEDSKNLVKILNNIEIPNDSNGNPVSKEDFCKQAYDTIDSFRKNAIDINALSTTLFGDNTRIMQYAEENNIELSTGFVADKNIVRNLITRFINADNIILKYPPSYYGAKIKIDTQSPHIVIIESESFAKAIKEQEQEYAKS